MSKLSSIEKRVADLEKRVLELSQPAPAKKHWLEAMAGSMADFPQFDEVVRLGQDFRRNYDRLAAAERRKARKRRRTSKPMKARN